MLASSSIDTLIVGAGFSGLCLAIKLRQAGHSSFLLIDKSHDLGGTWTFNRYPGCSCDVPSHLYSFSFDLNPDWSKMYADRREIHDYLTSCAQRHGLLPHLLLNTEMREAVWDEAAGLWHVDVRSHETTCRVDVRFLVSAIGALHVPKYPDLKGMQNFVGPSFHSSHWDPSVELEGKAVAVIGTGASAIQIVPEIAPIVDKLYVFQRTPAWILPKFDFAIRGRWRRLFRRVPPVMRLFYHLLFWVHEFLLLAFLGVNFMRKVGEGVARRHMEKAIKNKGLRAALTPKYELGCKRVLLSSKFYPALARQNVELVTEGILEVREQSIVSCSSSSRREDDVPHAHERKVDVIIYATGFDILGQTHKPRVVGLAGVELKDSRSASMLGVTRTGFPNFFTLLGPNVGVGHTSLVLMIEAQVRYLLNCIYLLDCGHSDGYHHRCAKLPAMLPRILELRRATQSSFQQLLERRFRGTVWQPGGCDSWYVDPQTNRNPVIWPSSVIEFYYYAHAASPSDYHLR